MDNTEDRIALVVPSCDAYADVWPTLFEGLARFWPERPFTSYLVTNRLSPVIEGVRVIPVGEDVSWSDNLRNALERIPEPYVFLNMDDLVLCERVDHANVMEIIGRFLSRRGNYLRLNPCPRGVDVGEPLDVIPPGDVYRTSVMFALFRKDVLKSLLGANENAWAFERYGSVRSDAFDGWFSAKQWLVHYVNLVVQGKVDPRAVAALEARGIVHEVKRPTWSGLPMLTLIAKEKQSALLARLPRTWRRGVRHLFSSTGAVLRSPGGRA